MINREADSHIDEDHWLKQFEKNLQKSAVQSRKVDDSLFNQINSIMNGKSKYTSVSAAVDDMMNRSGLTSYLENVKLSEKQNNSKLAQDINDARSKDGKSKEDKKTPIVIRKYPNILNTIENIIKENKGNLSVPAIISRIQSIHKKDVSSDKDWDDNLLIILVSNLNLKEKSNNNNNASDHNLGKQDTNLDSDISENNDYFSALMPSNI